MALAGSVSSMAKQVEKIITLIDDLDGSVADKTINFSLDGRRYTVDLSAKNADHLHRILEPYIKAAQKARRPGPKPGQRSKGTPANAKAVRAWAKQKRIKVPATGRVPAAVMERYAEAHSG